MYTNNDDVLETKYFNQIIVDLRDILDYLEMDNNPIQSMISEPTIMYDANDDRIQSMTLGRIFVPNQWDITINIYREINGFIFYFHDIRDPHHHEAHGILKIEDDPAGKRFLEQIQRYQRSIYLRKAIIPKHFNDIVAPIDHIRSFIENIHLTTLHYLNELNYPNDDI